MHCYKLGSTPRSSEALSAASKAIEQAVANVIPSPQALQTPKGAALRISSSKRVSFGPYVSPEIIDKVSYIYSDYTSTSHKTLHTNK